MANRFILNETSYFGAGARKELGGEIRRRGFKKAFVVVDKDLVKFGVAEMVTAELNGVSYETFTDFKANPTVKNVKAPSTRQRASPSSPITPNSRTSSPSKALPRLQANASPS